MPERKAQRSDLMGEKEEMEEIERWKKLSEEFRKRLPKDLKKVNLGVYLRKLFEFAREKKLDPFDASAITMILTGSEPLSSLVKVIFLKKELKKRQFEEVI